MIRPIKMAKSSERRTSLGGLVVLEELARAVGVGKEVDEVLEGPKSGRGYQPRKFVQGLVWMLHAGGRRREDLRELREEPEVLEELGLEAVPDAGTVGTGCGAKGRQGLRGPGGESETGREVFAGGGRGSDSGCGRHGD